jgi:hypothetical protein
MHNEAKLIFNVKIAASDTIHLFQFCKTYPFENCLAFTGEQNNIGPKNANAQNLLNSLRLISHALEKTNIAASAAQSFNIELFVEEAYQLKNFCEKVTFEHCYFQTCASIDRENREKYAASIVIGLQGVWLGLASHAFAPFSSILKRKNQSTLIVSGNAILNLD